jgi:hypothetical protein
MAAVTNFLTKALSPSYYKQQYKNFLVNSYNYYHPLFRSGRYEMHETARDTSAKTCPSMIPCAHVSSLSCYSATPLWHMMMGVSLIMYTSSYLARDCK